ncbi:MAG: hypothetical protein ABH803_00260 [Candidatus Micrarchaeota archaeon]
MTFEKLLSEKQKSISVSPNYQKIFERAEQILKIRKPEKTRFVFLGQGMRPLYIALRCLNARAQKIPEKNLFYLVTLPRYFYFDGPRERISEYYLNELKKRGFSKKFSGNTLVFDFIDTNRTFKSLSKAINFITKTKPSLGFKKADTNIINFIENMARPTEKHVDSSFLNPKIILSPGSQKNRFEYLLFLHSLHKYLKRRKTPGT